MNGLRLALVALLSFGASFAAIAADAPKRVSVCKDVAEVKALFPPRTTFTVITPGQYHFAQGLYVAAPNTPQGLPPGKSALLALPPKAPGGVLLFIDGLKACDPMGLPGPGVNLLMRIITGGTDSDGDEL